MQIWGVSGSVLSANQQLTDFNVALLLSPVIFIHRTSVESQSGELYGFALKMRWDSVPNCYIFIDGIIEVLSI
jgi:hypothetical protein